VTVLDIDGLALALAERNIERNALSGRVQFVEASWGDPPTVGPFDVVLGADIVYDTDEHHAIIDFLEKTLAPDGVALFTDPNRLTLVAFVHWLEERGWHVVETAMATPDLAGTGAAVGVTLIEARRGPPPAG
jgi:predicted nicotinamide N-methyase